MIDLNDGWLIYGIIPVINNFVYREEKFRNLQKREKGIGGRRKDEKFEDYMMISWVRAIRWLKRILYYTFPNNFKLQN